jgi:hypothetical protein
LKRNIVDLYLAVAADGFNLYLVDETGTNLRLFTAENDEYINRLKIRISFDIFSEQTACVVPVHIEPGHCIAGYVASSKQTVRINDISVVRFIENSNIISIDNFSKLDQEKYPDGLYIKDDKVTAVMAHPIINASGTLLGMKKIFHRNESIFVN